MRFPCFSKSYFFSSRSVPRNLDEAMGLFTHITLSIGHRLHGIVDKSDRCYDCDCDYDCTIHSLGGSAGWLDGVPSLFSLLPRCRTGCTIRHVLVLEQLASLHRTVQLTSVDSELTTRTSTASRDSSDAGFTYTKEGVVVQTGAASSGSSAVPT